METPETTEDQRIEAWNTEMFLRLDFSGEDAVMLVEWGVDPHDAEKLLFRDGERTSCTHELAMEILSPLVGAESCATT